MAKMKIHEISKSLKTQGKDIKSADLIALLQANGFEAKSANSNIEDAAIAFLLKHFADNNSKAATSEKAVDDKKSSAKESSKEPAKETAKDNVKDNPDKAVEAKPVSEKEVKADEKTTEKAVKADKKEAEKNSDSAGKNRNDDKTGRVYGDSRENRDYNRDGKPQREQKNAYNNQQNNSGFKRNDRNDNRSGNGNKSFSKDNAGNRGGRDNRRPNGDRVFEKYEKSQNSFDSIKQEQKPGRTQRQGKDNGKRDNKKYEKNRKDFDNEDTSKLTKADVRKKKDPNRKGAFIKPEVVKKEEPEDSIRTITLPEKLTLKEFGDRIKVPAAQIVKKLFMKGKMISINQVKWFPSTQKSHLKKQKKLLLSITA